LVFENMGKPFAVNVGIRYDIGVLSCRNTESDRCGRIH
jgi:hypothetical protein